ncbi:MAG TPA: hypothetical protein VGC84_04315 [Ilumatobacteraceae bacterium]
MTSAVASPRLTPIVDALIARSNGRYDAEFLRTLVIDLANQFQDAPVKDYIEVLIAKQAADELRKLDALKPLSQ